MGPKLLNVPILLGLAYIGIGYVSWIVGSAILGAVCMALRGSRFFTTPLLAAFVMVAWDLSMDPIWCNLGRAWVWHDGGPWFGVPVSNFGGWYLTVWAIYQCFALYLRGRPLRPQPSPGLLKPAILMYAVCAAGNLLVAAPHGMNPHGMKMVTDGAGILVASCGYAGGFAADFGFSDGRSGSCGVASDQRGTIA